MIVTLFYGRAAKEIKTERKEKKKTEKMKKTKRKNKREFIPSLRIRLTTL